MNEPARAHAQCDVRREFMMTKTTRVVLASVVVGALCLTTDAFARGGGGGHGGGGGGHFGGSHFGGGHVGAAALGHSGGAGLGHVGGAHFAHIGPAGLGHDGVGGSNRIHDLANFNGHGFNRNAFGSERVWNRWGDH